MLLHRSQIALVSRLLSVASSALMANPGIILLALGIQALIAQVAVPLVLAIAATLTNGQVVYNPDRDTALPDVCVGEGGAAVQCCVWQVRGSGLGPVPRGRCSRVVSVHPSVRLFVCLSLASADRSNSSTGLLPTGLRASELKIAEAFPKVP